MSFHENLRKARLARGLTQEALGEKLNMSPQAVSKWERGECMPDAALLPQLAETLGLSLDRLFGRKTLHFEDAAQAAQDWLLSLDGQERWRQALRLGQVIQRALSGIMDGPVSSSFAAHWIREDERDTASARTEGFFSFSRREKLSFLTLFPTPEGGWSKALEEDRPALWEALADEDVRKTLRLVCGMIGQAECFDRAWLEQQLAALEIGDPKGTLETLGKLGVVSRRKIRLDGKETEILRLYLHVNLLQILLLGSAGPWGTAGYLSDTPGFVRKEDRE